MTEQTKWLGWFDGATVPNPGQRGIGGLLLGPDGQRIEISRDMAHGTNNEAEFLALSAVLEAAVQSGITSLVVHGDSKLVIMQCMGEWAIRAKELVPLCKQAQGFMRQIGDVKLKWIPREENGEADTLSKRAIGYQAKPEREACWVKATAIGKRVGKSAVAIGKLLDVLGLREGKHASQLAVDLGLGLNEENNFGVETFWHCDGLVQYLRDKRVVIN